MRRLPLIIIGIFLLPALWAQNPHGDKLVVDCKACHTPGSWDYMANEKLFSHESTGFALEGQHANTACKECHTDLVFEETENTCVACHTGVHSMSVGNDCARCHTPENWLVDNIPELHEANGFPLLGAHRFTACTDCHQSETNLRWERLGNECAMCHMNDYNTAEAPPHTSPTFSTNCTECHDPFKPDWRSSTGDFHLFFPLKDGHDITDCSRCHDVNNYAAADPACISCHQDKLNNLPVGIISHNGLPNNCAECHNTISWSDATFNHSLTSAACIQCHQEDYDNADPSHANQSTDCAQCHNTNSWDVDHDGMYFRIYSGKHDGEWNTCTDCHTTGSWMTYSCIHCHNDQDDLFDEHQDEGVWEYDRVTSFVSSECFRCHKND